MQLPIFAKRQPAAQSDGDRSAVHCQHFIQGKTVADDGVVFVEPGHGEKVSPSPVVDFDAAVEPVHLHFFLKLTETRKRGSWKISYCCFPKGAAPITPWLLPRRYWRDSRYPSRSKGIPFHSTHTSTLRFPRCTATTRKRRSSAWTSRHISPRNPPTTIACTPPVWNPWSAGITRPSAWCRATTSSRWAIKTACALRVAFRDAGLDIQVAVNILARNLKDEQLPGYLFDLLQELGSDGGKGYLMSRPLPIAEFHRWLRTSEWGLGTVEGQE